MMSAHCRAIKQRVWVFADLITLVELLLSFNHDYRLALLTMTVIPSRGSDDSWQTTQKCLLRYSGDFHCQRGFAGEYPAQGLYRVCRGKCELQRLTIWMTNLMPMSATDGRALQPILIVNGYCTRVGHHTVFSVTPRQITVGSLVGFVLYTQGFDPIRDLSVCTGITPLWPASAYFWSTRFEDRG